MSSSTSLTLLSLNARQHSTSPDGGCEPPTRIPQPSVQSPLRRSHSLRVRTDQQYDFLNHAFPNGSDASTTTTTTNSNPSSSTITADAAGGVGDCKAHNVSSKSAPDTNASYSPQSKESSRTPLVSAGQSPHRSLLPNTKSLTSLRGAVAPPSSDGIMAHSQHQHHNHHHQHGQHSSSNGAASNASRACNHQHSHGEPLVESASSSSAIRPNNQPSCSKCSAAGCSPNKASTSNGGQRHRGMSLDLNNSCHSANGHHSPMQPRRSVNRSPSTGHSPPKTLAPRTPSGGGHTYLPPTNIRLTPQTPPVSPDDPLTGGAAYPDDDLDSVYSYTSMASCRSTMSCDHPSIARNGTTYSGRQQKYVFHSSTHAGQTGADYLTPTQRAQKQINRLKFLLSQARGDLVQRDSEILRLTKEVVELRLFKASLSSPEDRSNSSEAVTVRENDLKTSQDVSPIVHDPDEPDLSMSKSLSPSGKLPPYNHHRSGASFLDKINAVSICDMQSSYADSGHFEDTATSSVHSKDSFVQAGSSSGLAHDGDHHQQEHQLMSSSSSPSRGAMYDRSELIKFYELKIDDLIKNHSDESQEVKVTHNDRVEALLQKLAECNTRYADLAPDHEQAKERIRDLERHLEELQVKLQEQENTQNKMYLQMYAKGQEAERIQQADKVMELAANGCASGSSGRVSVPQLMQQLQVTQNELENIKDTNYVQERGSAQVLLSAKEAISLWLLGARKTMYRRLIDAQQSQCKVDPEVTLQFLKSAVYYFLTDKENSKGHLNAIESILGFSDKEKLCIEKARANK